MAVLSFLRRVFRRSRLIIGPLRKEESDVTVVYLDSVFLLNGLMDYLLLLAAARLAGLGLKRRRYLLAAMFGGAYAAAVFLPQTGFLSQMPSYGIDNC